MIGPDLTNHIVGVITRCREESIVIMGDTEAMFYQVLFPEKDKRKDFYDGKIITSTIA